MIVVSDTSPITNLWQIGRIDLLRDLYHTVIIPESVSREIARIKTKGLDLAEFDWIRVHAVSNLALLDELLDSLDRGEAEAITLARELNADLLLIDETAGRDEAKRLNVKITGLLGVLLRAKELGKIPFVAPEIDKLKGGAEFWIDEGLISDVLRLAGEK